MPQLTGDTQIAAIGAAISMSDFMVEGPGLLPTRVCLKRNAQCFKGSIQLSGRKKPLRHLIDLSEEFASGNRSATSGRTLPASSDKGFIWASIADIYGIPSVPEWAYWFQGELNTHHPIAPTLGIGCSPIIIKGDKTQFLDWLSWGVDSEAIRFPADNGPVYWPRPDLNEMFWTGSAIQTRLCYNPFPHLTDRFRCSKNNLLLCTECSHVTPQEFCVLPLDI
jgi:hypothetical protein